MFQSKVCFIVLSSAKMGRMLMVILLQTDSPFDVTVGLGELSPLHSGELQAQE